MVYVYVCYVVWFLCLMCVWLWYALCICYVMVVPYMSRSIAWSTGMFFFLYVWILCVLVTCFTPNHLHSADGDQPLCLRPSRLNGICNKYAKKWSKIIIIIKGLTTPRVMLQTYQELMEVGKILLDRVGNNREKIPNPHLPLPHLLLSILLSFFTHTAFIHPSFFLYLLLL